MKRIAWTSDIHLDRLIERDYAEFKEHLEELNPECLLISGDIAEGDVVYKSLKDFNDAFSFPIYFVLGNHDFYFGRFEEIKREIRGLVSACKNIHWLSECGVVALNQSTALIGIEGWGDGQYAPVAESGLAIPKDFFTIKDLAELKREQFGSYINKLGEASAKSLRPVLLEAVNNYEKIIFVTHVPPFREASLDRSGRICDDIKVPFYTCKAIGDLLLEVMSSNPSCQMTVLCGHTHEKCEVQILENLRVRVKDASYGSWWDATIINLD